MVDSKQLSTAFRSGRLAARAALVESVEGTVLRLSDGSTLEVSERGMGADFCLFVFSCLLACMPACNGRHGCFAAWHIYRYDWFAAVQLWQGTQCP